MGDSLKSNFSTVEKSEVVEKESNILPSSKITEIHPLAFTIEFDSQKFDESRTSKVRERLNAFTLKHKRNPSLPDFREVNDHKSCPQKEKAVSPDNEAYVRILNKRLEKSGKILETQWKSTPLKTTRNFEFKTPFSIKKNLGMRENIKCVKIGRRYSLDGADGSETPCQILNLGSIDSKIIAGNSEMRNNDIENKSDTVSEAGTYTVDKENEEGENDVNKTCGFKKNEGKENVEYLNEIKKSDHRNWITDWVRDVEEQNLHNTTLKGPPPLPNTKNINGSCGTSKIPSPLNTLVKKAKPRCMKSGNGNNLNGYAFHRRSSSLNAKDYNENRGSESSLETESFLKTTESVMTSMQNRMRFSFERKSPEFKRIEKKNSNHKERPHPPSTASDTDTNSETDAKTFKKPTGNPFTSARLNRAFSLRRAKAEPEKDLIKVQPLLNYNESGLNGKQSSVFKGGASKPPSSTPFSRLDCGRFSMRTAVSSIRSNVASTMQKKEAKKPNGSNRSSSSLSSREVEFQNWRRRKSFDPMKAAAEGRKKELAKKAAMSHCLAQSINLGSGCRTRNSQSSAGNPVLRSASFHSTAQVLGGEENEKFLEQESTDEQESASSSHFSDYHSRPRNSPLQPGVQCIPPMKTSVLSSRSSLVSETHSSPSRRLRSNDLENLVLSAISEASLKLKFKSCKLLRKLSYLNMSNEDKSFKLREEIAVLESGQNSLKNSSSVYQATSGDLSTILKNLKAVDNVFNVLEDFIFEENLEGYINE